MVSVSVSYLFYQPMDEKIKTCTLRFPAKENRNMEKASGFDWSIVSQYDVKTKYRLISRKFLGMKFFHPSVCLPTKSHARLYPFDKPIKSLYFRSFVVSVLFARFHFKVIRKSLYLEVPTVSAIMRVDCKLSPFPSPLLATFSPFPQTESLFTG